jgi:acetate kinase
VTPGVLVLNAGSSSLKFGLYEIVADAPNLIERGGQEAGEAPLSSLLAWAEARTRLVAVGHRVVHGGAEFTEPTAVSAEVLARLERLIPLAPLHEPQALEAIREVAALRPALMQVACFDTAFHAGHAPAVDRLPLPRELAEAKGIRRYGFHGLSYEHLARRLNELDPALASGRVVMAHLGAGASLCAVKNGRSLDTTMGFSTLDGLVMATRCGALDPGVLLHLIQAEGLTVAEVQEVLYKRSGLLGLSGFSGDMRELLASDRPEAAEAIEGYVLEIVRKIGALAAVMQGLDGLVFSGGVGENAAPIRALVCDRLRWLGVRLDPEANAAGVELISRAGSPPVRIIPADEEGVIARHTAKLAGADLAGPQWPRSPPVL